MAREHRQGEGTSDEAPQCQEAPGWRAAGARGSPGRGGGGGGVGGCSSVCVLQLPGAASRPGVGCGCARLLCGGTMRILRIVFDARPTVDLRARARCLERTHRAGRSPSASSYGAPAQSRARPRGPPWRRAHRHQGLALCQGPVEAVPGAIAGDAHHAVLGATHEVDATTHARGGGGQDDDRCQQELTRCSHSERWQP